ncbi:MAG: proprotein convertase P-domain-containing protein, partial [Phycisphaerae bacterium]
MKKILGTAAALGLATTAMAVDYNGGGGAIPDLVGGVPGQFSSSLNVPDSFALADVDVTVNLNHTWVGDLIMTVTHGANSAILVNRVGGTTPTSVGDSSDYGGAYRFDSQSGNSIWAAAATAGATAPIPVGTYDTSDALTGAGNNSLDVFNGQNVSGNWTLSISDNAGLDTGVVNSWTLHATAVPEPASLSLLALGGLA